MQGMAVTRIQARWRGRKQRLVFLQVRAYIVLLQTAVRHFNARRAYLQTQAAVVILQSAWKARQARRLLKSLKVVMVVYFRNEIAQLWTVTL